MAFYSFVMKKGKYQIIMKSDDIYFARKQVGNLFDSLLKVKGRVKVVLPPVPEKISETVKIAPEPEVQEEKPAEIAEIIEEAIIEKAVEIPQEENPKEKVEQLPVVAPVIEPVVEPIIEPVSEPPVVEAVIQQVIESPAEFVQVEPVQIIEEVLENVEIPPVEMTEEVEALEEEPVEVIPEIIVDVEEQETEKTDESIEKQKADNNLFENILAEKTSEIEEAEALEEKQEIKEEPEIIETEPAPQPAAKKAFSFKKIITDTFKAPEKEEPSQQKLELKPTVVEVIEEDYDEDIEETIEKQPQEPKSIAEIIEETNTALPAFETLEQLIKIKKPKSKMEYLLLTAYYLQIKENLFKFSLKQINGKSMPFLGSLIDHSVVHNAVAHDFIEVVQDFNGTSEVTEYRLTEEGENYFLET